MASSHTQQGSIPPNPPVGGLHVAWVLGDNPRTITLKGGEKTVIELRDPSRLSHSLVLWLDGAAGHLASVPPGVAVQLHLESVRSGRNRGELVGTVSRPVVEAAFARSTKQVRS